MTNENSAAISTTPRGGLPEEKIEADASREALTEEAVQALSRRGISRSRAANEYRMDNLLGA